VRLSKNGLNQNKREPNVCGFLFLFVLYSLIPIVKKVCPNFLGSQCLINQLLFENAPF